MATKPAPKKTVKAKTAAQPAAKAAKPKAPARPTAPAKTSGMWKILEQKQAHQKELEQARSEGRHSQHGQGQSFHANPRDKSFTKFAGPRRKAG